MDKKKWITKIKSSCKKAGTYKPFFDAVIDTLGDILEKRDNANEMFIKSGGNILVKHTNKGGATNIEKNPTLVIINDLNRDALVCWRESGLTKEFLQYLMTGDDKGVKAFCFVSFIRDSHGVLGRGAV